MNPADLLHWMRDHRAGCSRCGRVQTVYFRDHAERRVGFCCVIDAAGAARAAVAEGAVDMAAAIVARRLRELTGGGL